MRRGAVSVLVVGLLWAVGCSGDDATGESPSAPATTAGAVTTASPASAAPTTTDAAASSGTPTSTASSAPDSAGGTAPASTPATTLAPNAPGETWESVDPAVVGFDQDALDRLAQTAEQAGSTCTAIVRDGHLVDERTFGGVSADEPREVWSVTKSVTSVLVGIAADQGLLTVDDPVAKYVPEWAGTASGTVTIRNLLSNDSGRHWDTNTDYVEMATLAEDKTAFAIGLGQDAAPGTVWAYNNSAIQVLSRVLEQATGEAPAAFAERVLFEPIGMTHSTMTSDAAGNTTTYAGLRSTCLDLARFGWLIEQHGWWNGTQVVSAAYVANATGASSTSLNAAYGWLWWLNRRGPIGGADVATSGPGDGSIADGQLLTGQPEDIFWALGLFDQIVAVVPDDDLVAVRLGAQPDAVSFNVVDFTNGVLGAFLTDG